MYKVFSFVLTHVKIKNVNEFRQDAIHKLVISENNKPATSRTDNMLLKPNKNKNSQQPLITTKGFTFILCCWSFDSFSFVYAFILVTAHPRIHIPLIMT